MTSTERKLNEKRIGRAARLMELASDIWGNGDPVDGLTDILTDLRHFCADRKISLARALRISKAHYEAETL